MILLPLPPLAPLHTARREVLIVLYSFVRQGATGCDLDCAGPYPATLCYAMAGLPSFMHESTIRAERALMKHEHEHSHSQYYVEKKSQDKSPEIKEGLKFLALWITRTLL